MYEHDVSFSEVWRAVRARHSAQQPPPSSERSTTPKRVVEVSTGRGASASPQRLDETLGFSIESTESLGVDPSPPFEVPSLGGDKVRRGEKYRHYSIDDKYLLYKGRVCVLAMGDFWRQILIESHDSPSAGHPGIQKTYALVKRQFYWPSLFKDVQDFVQQCKKCQVNKHERLKVGGLLHPLDIPRGKWESISMDFITGLPRTNRGNDSVWVVVDRLTKMVKFIPTKKTVKTPELARLFIEHLYKLYGLPASIVSDRDRKFDSHFWREVFKKLETTLSMSTADHPQSDGQTERVNQVLEDMLRAYVSKNQSNWEEYLPHLEFAYNSSKHSATGFSPFMLMYGFQPRSPMAVGLEKEKLQSVKEFLEDMQDMLQAAKDSIRSAQDRAKTYANKGRREVTFEEGEFVYLKVPAKSETLKTGKCEKLSPRFCGPFKVLKKVGGLAYKLELPESSRVHPVFHVSRLRKIVDHNENVVSPSVLVELIEPPSIPHEPERILGFRDRNTRHTVYREALVKWKDREDEASSWERVSTLTKNFSEFVFADENSS